MYFRRATFSFFCAAAFGAFPQLSAEDEAKTVYNLSGGGEQSGDGKLVVVQEIDGEFSGNFSGEGINLEKQGAAKLTLSGNFTGTGISVSAGTLALADGFTLPEKKFSVSNSAALTIAMSGDSDALEQLVVADSEKVGTVNNVGAGTVSVQNLAGKTLNVNAGTLAVLRNTNFSEINILRGATLKIGDGLSGNVALESGAQLVFSRDSAASSLSYSEKISGAGDVVFDGKSPVYFSGGNDQTYTGTTTVNAGGMIFEKSEKAKNAPKLSSAKIDVAAAGTFGGHVTAAGTVDIAGTEFSSAGDWENKIGKNTFGSWWRGAGTLFADGGDVLTLDGDLKIAKTDVRYTIDYEAQTINYFGNSGGAVRVNFDGNGAGKIVANGNVELGGTLLLVGANGLKVGQRAVIFESDPAKTKGSFDQIVYGSDNVVLLTAGVGGIKDGQYGMASVENRNVRKRKNFEEHEGLENFVDYLVANADADNKVVQAVAIADAEAVTDTVNNFSALSYFAFAEMAQRQSDSELDMLLLNVARARAFPPASADGMRVEKNFTFFSGLLTDVVSHKSGGNVPVYDFDSLGVYAGGHTWLDDERMAGFTLGAHHGAAQPHGNGGSLKDEALRARIFAVFAPKFSEWFLTLGTSFGAHYYDIERKTALGENTGTAPGADVGIFAAFNYRTEIENKLFFTPYARFDYNFVYVGSVDERGSASRLNVDHINFNTFRARFGSGFEYVPAAGTTFGIDFGFIAAFGGDTDVAAEFAEYENSRTKIKSFVGEKMNFELAPRFSVELGNDWQMDAAYRFQSSFSGSVSHSFDIGIGKRF